MKLDRGPQTAAIAAQVVLEEIGAPFETEKIDR